MVPTAEEIRGQRNYLPAARKSLHQIFYDFFLFSFFFWQKLQPFPLAISLYCGYGHDITSTELLWSTHCTVLINEDPNAASCFPLLENSLPPFTPTGSSQRLHLML